MRPSRVIGTWAAASLLLAASALPALAQPKSGSFVLEACLPARDQIQLDIAWQGIRADQYGFGVGMKNGSGLGVMSEPFTPTASGSASQLLPRRAGQQEVEVAGAQLLWKGQVVASASLDRPRQGWPSCA